VWTRTIDGRTLTFHLAGINNQNFLMRDEETGSYWQQISGLAVSGPLAGKQLELVHSDELTFGLWRTEQPNGTVLKPVAKFSKNYEDKDWDVKMAKARTVIDFPGSGLPPRELILGVKNGDASRAFPISLILAEKLVQDRVGPKRVLLVVGSDNKSIRAFETPIAGTAPLDLYRDTQSSGLLRDSAGNTWNFQGCSTSGPSQSPCLKPVYVIKDYWFDWRNYNPHTTIYKK
jgi:hypothetical protein